MEIIIKETGEKKEINYLMDDMHCEADIMSGDGQEQDDEGNIIISAETYIFWTRVFARMDEVDDLKVELENEGMSPEDIFKAVENEQDQNDIQDMVLKEKEILTKLLMDIENNRKYLKP